MCYRKPKPGRRAVVEHIRCKVAQMKRFRKGFHGFRKIVEAVRVAAFSRDLPKAKTRLPAPDPIAVLGRHADPQLLELVGGALTARATLLAAIIFPGQELAVPRQERLRRDEGGQFAEHPATEFLGPHRQTPALVVVQAQPTTAELFPKNSVLLREVVDDVLALSVRPAREENQQESKPDRVPDASIHRITLWH
jgi:hypothetical protein